MVARESDPLSGVNATKPKKRETIAIAFIASHIAIEMFNALIDKLLTLTAGI